MSRIMRPAWRAILFAAVLFVSAQAAAATPEDELKYRADLEEGISMLKTGVREEIQRAIARLKNALKVNPESAEAYFWLALAQSDLGLYAQAAQSARDATVYDDRLAEAWSLWGQALLYQRAWEDAQQKLETAQRLLPDDPIVHYNLGRVYYHGRKDYSSALAQFRSAWQKSQSMRRDNPDFSALGVNSRMYMGLCEYERGLESGKDTYFNNAINAFLDVLKEQPDNYEVAMRLALAYRKNSRTAESETLLRNLYQILEQPGPNAERNRPLLAEVNLQLADIYMKDPAQRNPLFAQSHLREFVRLIGDSNHPALEPARAYLEEKQQ